MTAFEKLYRLVRGCQRKARPWRGELQEDLLRVARGEQDDFNLRWTLELFRGWENPPQPLRERAALIEQAIAEVQAWNIWDEAMGQVRRGVYGRTFPLLQLTTPFSCDDVTQKFRQRALELHPDRGGDATQFQQLVMERNKALSQLRGLARKRTTVAKH